MNAIYLIQRMQQHRMWTNAKLLDTASRLNESQLRQTFPIGQGSVWKTLVHMFGAEYVWCEAFHGNEAGVAPGDIAGKLPGNQMGESPIGSLAQLEQFWTALNVRWIACIEQLGDASLDDIVYRVSAATGQRSGTRRSDVLLHLNFHAHYTAAQAINMFRQLGLDKLPDPMMVTMAREECN